MQLFSFDKFWNLDWERVLESLCKVEYHGFTIIANRKRVQQPKFSIFKGEVSEDTLSEDSINIENYNTDSNKLVNNYIIEYKINYKDKYMYFNGILKDNNKNDNFFGNYYITDSLQFIIFKQKTGFLKLGKEKQVLNITSSNPNMSFINASDIQIKDIKEKKWNIGIEIFYGYNGNKFIPIIGIGISKTIFSF